MSDESRPRQQVSDATGSTVASNVRRVRESRRLSTYELASRLKNTDRPIAAAALGKIERGERRVDVGDLMALAVTLDVSPASLLLPPKDDQGDLVEVTGAGEVPADTAWSWASNERPLRLPDGDTRNSMLEYQLYGLPPGRRAVSQHVLGDPERVASLPPSVLAAALDQALKEARPDGPRVD